MWRKTALGPKQAADIIIRYPIALFWWWWHCTEKPPLQACLWLKVLQGKVTEAAAFSVAPKLCRRLYKEITKCFLSFSVFWRLLQTSQIYLPCGRGTKTLLRAEEDEIRNICRQLQVHKTAEDRRLRALANVWMTVATPGVSWWEKANIPFRIKEAGKRIQGT